MTHLLALLLLPSALAGQTPPDIRARLERLRTAAEGVSQCTYTFRRHEWTDGRQQPPHEMAVKFRKPMDIYMKWVGDTHKGRELLYRQGWNEGDMMVKPGPMIPTLSLDPKGKLAMRGSRHGIDMIDLSNVADIILDQTDRLEASATLSATYTSQGAQTVNGEASWCVQIDLPKDQDTQLYAYRVDMCLSDRTGLLTRLRAWDQSDGELRKVEDYEFRNINLSPGLTDQDFSDENPGYGF